MAIPKNAIRVKQAPLNYTKKKQFKTMLWNNRNIISFYKMMYETYKHNIGELTTSGNKITEKMLETMKSRMLDLMGPQRQ